MAASEYVLRGPELSIHLPTFKRNTSVLDVFYECMKNNGSDVAQIEAETGNSITYEELYNASISIASNLKHQYGVTRGDIVALCTETDIDAYCMFFGVIFTGATAALLSPKLKQDDFQQLLAETKSKLVYCNEECVETVTKAAAADSCTVIVANAERYGPSNYIDYRGLVKCRDTSFRPFEVADITKHTPVLVFSSGTTGTPKGILMTNIGLQRLAYIFCRNEMKMFISVSSFIWISSMATATSGIIKKHTVIWSPQDMEKLLKYTEKYKADTWMLTPGGMNLLMKHSALNKYSVSSLRNIFIGGAVLTKRLLKPFIETVCRNRIGVVNLYGSTEAGIITDWPHDMDLVNTDKAGSVGRLSSGAELKFVDENGKAVGPNIDGELLVKNIAVMAGYWGAQKSDTACSVNNEGWFRIGDVGHYDSDGYIYVTGRKKDIVLVKNEKVSVAEVGALVASHPDVQEALVIAKSHPVDANHLTAFVVRKESASHLTENDIIKFVEDQAEDTKRLRGGVIFLDGLPKTVSGKTDQHVLYEKLKNLVS